MSQVTSIRQALVEMQIRLQERAGDGFAKMNDSQFDDWVKNNPGGAEKAKQARAAAQARTQQASGASAGSTSGASKPAGTTSGATKPPTTTTPSSGSSTSGSTATPSSGSTSGAAAKPAAALPPSTAASGTSKIGSALTKANPVVTGAVDYVSRRSEGESVPRAAGGAVSSAAGAAAGAKAGAALGSFAGPVGTVVGGIGGAVAGSLAAGKAYDYVTNKSGSAKADTPAAAPAKAEPAKATPAPTAAPAKSGGANSADKAVGVVKTKGGDYNIYKKDSQTAADFRSTYAAASKAGAGTFKWKDAQGNERSYTTGKKGGEYKAPTAAPATAAAADPEKKTAPAVDGPFKGGSSQTAAGNSDVAKGITAAPVASGSSGPEGVKKADQMANTSAAIRAAAARKAGEGDTPANVIAKNRNGQGEGGVVAGTGVTSKTLGDVVAGADPGRAADARARAAMEPERREKIDADAKVRQAEMDKARTDNIGKQNDIRIKKTGEEPGFSGAAGAALEKDVAKVTPPAASSNTSAAPAPANDESKKKPPTAQSLRNNTLNKLGQNESVNPMIAGFLKLQEVKHSNIFEAAKKLKGDQHKLDKNKNGMLDKDDFEKLRAEEMGTGMVKKDGKDYVPDSIAKNPHMQVSKDGPSKADKKALDNKFKEVAKEEVEFSAEELAHIELVLGEDAVKRRGRPPKEGSAAYHRQQGTKPDENTAAESPIARVAAQIRTTRSNFADGKNETVRLQHPVTKKYHEVPVKAANDFNREYATAEKPDHKDAVEASFIKKHMS